MRKLVLTMLFVCLMQTVYAAAWNSEVLIPIESPELVVSNRYTDPSRAVTPSELGDLSLEQIKVYVLDLHQKINAYRAENGKAPLVIHPQINWWSQVHSEWMAAGRYGLSHEGAQERYLALAEQLPRVVSGAENVASAFIGQTNPVEVSMIGWVNSPGHRANILGDYNLTGYGVAKSPSGVWYLTEFFIKTLDDAFVSKSIVDFPEWNGGNVTPPNDAIQELHNFPIQDFRNQLLRGFNEVRQQNSKVALKYSSFASYQAQLHSDAVALGKYPMGDTDHDKRAQALAEAHPDVLNVAEWYAAVDVNDANASSSAVALLLSDGAKVAELLSENNAIGFGIAKSLDGHYYFTVIIFNSNNPYFYQKY